LINCLITGSSGFVGTNLLNHFKSIDNIKTINLDLRISKSIEISDDIDCVIHLAGKSHDLKNISDPSEYYYVNYELTKNLFDAFIDSKAEIFIFISSVKAAVDYFDDVLTEQIIPVPSTHYGISKLQAEKYIIKNASFSNKKYFILRPSLIHGPGNKGNFNLLFKFMKYGIPWPLGSFNNNRSFCSIDNLTFVIEELITRKDIVSGIYNVTDDQPMSTNQLIEIISKATNKKIFILHVPKWIIKILARIGDIFPFPINSEKLQKLTENYVVSNLKLKQVLKKDFPIISKNGLLYTFNSFKSH
jgi:nucleoside-diphosphate-sugar epimerase